MFSLINTNNLRKFFLAIYALTAIFSLSLIFSPSAGAQVDNKKLCSGANFDLSGSKTDCSKTQAGNACHESKDGPVVDCNDKSLNRLIAQIINIISIIVGVVAVIMMIYGGFRYITSGGDSGKVGEAKQTIIYAIVGLIIVALAQFIVKFVLEKAAKT